LTWEEEQAQEAVQPEKVMIKGKQTLELIQIMLLRPWKIRDFASTE